MGDFKGTPEQVTKVVERTAVTVVWTAVAEASTSILSNVDEGAKRIYDKICGTMHSAIGSDQEGGIVGEDHDLDVMTCSYDLDDNRSVIPWNRMRYEAGACAWYLDEQHGVMPENWMVHETDPYTPTTAWRIVSQKSGRAMERVPSIASNRRYR